MKKESHTSHHLGLQHSQLLSVKALATKLLLLLCQYNIAQVYCRTNKSLAKQLHLLQGQSQASRHLQQMTVNLSEILRQDAEKNTTIR